MNISIRFVLLLLLTNLFISGCTNKQQPYKDRYTLQPSTKSIKIRLGPNSKNLSNAIQYFVSDNIEYLATLNIMTNSIEIYNLNTLKLLTIIKINTEGANAFNEVFGFTIKNFDSILIFSALPKKLGIIDTSGNLIKTIRYEKDANNITTRTLPPLSNQRPFCIGNKVYLNQAYTARESNGKLTETGQKQSFISLSIDINSGICQSSLLTYPTDLINKNVLIMPIYRVLGFNNSFVYHFGFLKEFFVTHDFQKFERFPISSNYDLRFFDDVKSSLDKGLNDMLVHDEMINMYYDEFKQCYYIFIRKRETNYIKNASISTKFVYPNCIILILDKKLRHLGEVTFPENTYSFQMAFITKEGLYISEDNVNNETFNEDFMRFRLFSLEKI